MPETSVIDVLFRARDADKVAKAAQMVGKGLEDLAASGGEGAAGLDQVEEQAKKTDQALDDLENRKPSKKQTGPQFDPAATKDAKGLTDALKRMKQEAREADQALDKVGKGGLQGAKQSTKSLLQMGAAMGGVVIGVQLVAEGFRRLKQAWVDSVKAASVQEDANRALAVSFQTVGQYSKAAVQDIRDYASAIQQTTAFGDEATIKTAALIQQLGGLSGQALKDTTTAALDMAVAMERNVDQVAILLGKAAAGETGSLSEYGIIIDRSLPKSQQFAAALDAINAAFGGSAAARVKTYSGATAQMSNAMGDLREAIAEGVLPAMTKFANEATPKILALVDAIRGLRGETEHSAVELVAIMETQTAALRGLAGEQAQILEASRAQIQTEALAQLKLEVAKGDLDEAMETLGRLDDVVQSSTVKGEQVFSEFMDSMRREALRGLQVRLNVETARGRAALRSAVQQLQGEADLELLIKGTVDVQEARARLRGLNTDVEKLKEAKAKVQFIDEAELQETLDKALLRVDDLNAELSTLRIGADKSRLEQDIKETEEIISATQQRLAALNAQLQKGIDAGTVTFHLTPPPVDQIAQAMVDSQEVIDQQKALGATFAIKVEEAETVEELTALLAKASQQFVKLANEAEKSSGQKPAADAFDQELAKLQALVDVKRKLLEKPDISDTVDLVRSLQDAAGGTTTVDILDTEKLRQDVAGSEEALARLKKAVDVIVKSRDPQAVASAFVLLEAATLGAQQGVVELSGATLAYAEAAKAQLGQVAKQLEPFEKAEFLQASGHILIDTGDLEGAKAVLDALKVLVEEFPDLAIGLDLEAFREKLEAAKEGAGEAGDTIAQQLGDGVRGTVTSAFGSMFDTLISDARKGASIIEGVVEKMMDAVVKQLLRAAAFSFLNAILPGSSLVGKLFGVATTVSGKAGAVETSKAAGTVKPTPQGGPPSAGVESPRLYSILARQEQALRSLSALPFVTQSLVDQGRLGTLLQGGGGGDRSYYISALDALSFEQYLSPGQPGRRAMENLEASGRL